MAIPVHLCIGGDAITKIYDGPREYKTMGVGRRHVAAPTGAPAVAKSRKIMDFTTLLCVYVCARLIYYTLSLSGT